MPDKLASTLHKTSVNGLLLKISDVSRMLNVSSSTLRQWENAGLTQPTRTTSGYRTYSQEEVERLKYIQHLRTEKNLNVDAIRHLLESSRSDQHAPSPNASTQAKNAGSIGRHLRRLRRDHKMTLAAAAEGTGLSVSFLSSLERGQVHASIATLQKLSVFYKTSVLSFFGQSRKGSKLVRPHQRKELSNEPGIRIELLAFGNTMMEPHLFRLAPGASSGGSYHHEGEEFIYMVSGTCDIWLDEVEHYQLQEGDSLCFASSQTHRWSNPSHYEAVLLWINTPPTF